MRGRQKSAHIVERQSGMPGEVESEVLETGLRHSGSRTEMVMLKSPDEGARLERVSFVRPVSMPGSPAAMADKLGSRNVPFEANDLQAAVEWAARAGYELVGGIGEYEVPILWIVSGGWPSSPSRSRSALRGKRDEDGALPVSWRRWTPVFQRARR